MWKSRWNAWLRRPFWKNVLLLPLEIPFCLLLGALGIIAHIILFGVFVCTAPFVLLLGENPITVMNEPNLWESGDYVYAHGLWHQDGRPSRRTGYPNDQWT